MPDGPRARGCRHRRRQPDGTAQEVRVELPPDPDPGRLRFYYFAEGEVRRAPPVPATWLTPR
jgi:hypothetical protein